MRLSSALVVAGLLCLVGACGEDRPPARDDAPPSERDAGADQGPDPDDAAAPDADPCTVEAGLVETTGTCGNLVYEMEQLSINLYFVVDRSGSMDDSFDPVGRKYDAALDAIENVLNLIGHRVSYGASVFPGLSTMEQCSPGGEIFAARRGDRFGCPQLQLAALLSTLRQAGVGGGTPLAAHLQTIGPTLKNLEGNLNVILLTDGGANCNDDITCTAEDCNLSYQGLTLLTGQPCDLSYNCCDDTLTEPGAHLNCIDRTATESAVESLTEFGIRTYVVGMPGSEHVADHLSRLAELGGTARSEDPSYYPVANATELSEVFQQIGRTVALSCDIELITPPEDPALVNLYYDGSRVPYDATGAAGWAWADDTHTAIRVSGSHCQALESGGVGYVQLQWGCPTFIE